jgi:predicted DNA-binding transcriptional regulator AlpA
MYCLQQAKQKNRDYTNVKTVKLLCALTGISKPTIHGKITEVM